METPFIFGRIATDKNFTDREIETNHLVDNFKSLVNTIIISPRRWGKSSLVNKAGSIAVSKEKDLRICHLDLFNVRDEEHFYQLLAQEIIRATSSKWNDAVENVRKFFKKVVPKITLANSNVPDSSISLDFDWEDLKKNPDEVLDLAETAAKSKGLKIVVCIDEFQNIAEFDNANFFQKKLRSHWQLHQHVAYCLYGSKRHMMLDVFTNASKPFYKFGDLLFLNKIDTSCLVSFIMKRFSETNKKISSTAAESIVKLTDNHPYYAQQLAQLSWMRTSESCTEKTVLDAHISLVEQLSLLFLTMTEGLTVQQINLLHALSDNETALTSTSVMYKYHITSSTSVSRSKGSLIDKDILDSTADKLSFQDPIYAWWLKHSYFM